MKAGIPIFADSRQEIGYHSNVPVYSDREKKVELIIPTHMCTYADNLVKFGPLLSEIIGLQGDR